jgi:glycerol-1-phosphate dehydrogenase [NAD(P)+]
MQTQDVPVYVGEDALARLVDYCRERDMRRFYLVADPNTYPVLGRRVEETFQAAGMDVRSVLLRGDDIIAGEHYVMQLLVGVDREERTYLAVGSGTITDITRFVSHRTRTGFISVPTAPSVDGYTSGGAPLVIGRLKQTVYTHAPLAVFGDLKTLREAPRAMIASGFGDMLGKFTSTADWKLGRLVWDEPYSEAIAGRSWAALQNCVRHVDDIARASGEGVRRLMEGLSESGLCMLTFGLSHPASGAEHYVSHFLELKLLREGRPAVLHGAKVGAACILVARHYERIRAMAPREAAHRLGTTLLPDREEEVRRIRAAYPDIADLVIAEQAPFLDMMAADFEALKRKIVDRWAEVQAIAGIVPPAGQLADWLRRVGGRAETRELGLGDDEVAEAMEYAPYYRNRFSVLKLSRMLGLPPVVA